jgi:hypothetical protein
VYLLLYLFCVFISVYISVFISVFISVCICLGTPECLTSIPHGHFVVDFLQCPTFPRSGDWCEFHCDQGYARAPGHTQVHCVGGKWDVDVHALCTGERARMGREWSSGMSMYTRYVQVRERAWGESGQVGCRCTHAMYR